MGSVVEIDDQGRAGVDAGQAPEGLRIRAQTHADLGVDLTQLDGRREYYVRSDHFDRPTPIPGTCPGISKPPD